MNYSEETAQYLGARAGGLDLFDSADRHDTFMPAVSAGGSRDGAPMLKLEWRP